MENTNWAENLTYSTDKMHYPTLLEQVQEIVKKCSKIKTLGSRHSFNDIADSTENQVSLRQLNRVVSLDKAAHTATIEGGMRYGEKISPHLLVSEIRIIAADDLWMSPFYQRASIAFHFTWKQEWEAVKNLLPQIEKALSPYKPLPHWGKLSTIAPPVLQSCYRK